MEFDENLFYAYDCGYYYRYLLKYGNPSFSTDTTIANYLWENSITSQLTEEILGKESNYILKKHGFINENQPS